MSNIVFLAQTGYCTLGSVHETRQAAQEQATTYRDWNDNVSGYFRVFGKHSIEPAPVRPMVNECPTAEKYIAALNEYREEKRKFEEEVERMRQERFCKFFLLQRQYINLGTPYNHHDLIEVVYQRPSGRKHKVTGIVYDVWITEAGEIRPKIGKYYDNPDETIVSIRVVKQRNDMFDREIFRTLHNIK